MRPAARTLSLVAPWLVLGCAGGAGGAPDDTTAGDDASSSLDASSVAPSPATTDAAAALDASDTADVDSDAAAIDALADGATPSRCAVGPTPNDVACDHQTSTIGGRVVLWETPLGTPPDGGWPVAILFQGSLVTPGGASILAPHGAWLLQANDAALDGVFAPYVLSQLHTQITVIKSLLDDGYAVITPTADGGGFAWDTNLPPWSITWTPSPDAQFLTALFAAIGDGALGPLSTSRWYASGVSSGGYMTSRMAVSYDGRFRALAIAAGSYASCAGALPTCAVGPIPSDHPPTLFLHGGADIVVPVTQMYAYYDALIAAGRSTKAIVDANTLHGWAPQSPAAITAWFDAH